MKQNLIDNYQVQADKFASAIAALKRKNTAFITSELLLFGGIIVFLVCYFAIDSDTTYWLTGASLCLIAYFTTRHFDEKNKEKIEHYSALRKVFQDEAKALEGDFSTFETGEQYNNPQHPYSFDLDVFGKSSLFNRICRTITTGGSDVLAQNLTRETPLSRKEIEIRAELQKDLAKDTKNDSLEEYKENDSPTANWRIEFLALGEMSKNQTQNKNKKIDSNAVVEALQKVSKLEVPSWFGSPTSLLVGWMLITGVIASIVLSACHIISANIPLWWVMIQYLVVFFVCKRTLDKIDSNGGKLRHQLIAYSQILRLIANRNFDSELGKQMQTDLSEALPSFAQLEKILKGYDRRGNFLGLFFTDSFLLSDYFLVRSFLKWKNSYVVKMREWMDLISEMDAMVSLADYRFNHPEATDATIVDSQKVIFEAKNIYHPFLGQKAIKNDFTIKDDNYYIITGANMAGKSTFLRSLGVNYILGMAGMPVFADSLTISRFRLFSSMRTTDDLTHGISYFNAELIRLEQLLEYCKESSQEAEPLHTLIILDEILKGTNSLDKLNGSRRFLEAIAKQPVSGIIATHDLELSKMEEEYPNNFHNYCFEIDLGTDVTYTYKIQKGVARNQNATFLLNKILKRY